jgi:small-conductance mechanosensitive channel
MMRIRGILAIETVASVEWLKTHGVRIGVVLVLALAFSRVGTLAIRRVRRRLEGSVDVTAALSLQRTTTLVTTMAYAVRVVVWTIAILLILGELGINLAPLIAGAGIAGIALGFGAQSLVRDFLAGFFILLENQFAVGEAVEINAVGATVTGRVEALTLRVTSIRAVDGTLSIVPNGNIQVVSNKSRGIGRFTVEFELPEAMDPEEPAQRIDELCQKLRKDPAFQALVSWGPESLGAQLGDDGRIVVAVAAESKPSRRAQVEAELRARISQLFLTTKPDAAIP